MTAAGYVVVVAILKCPAGIGPLAQEGGPQQLSASEKKIEGETLQ